MALRLRVKLLYFLYQDHQK